MAIWYQAKVSRLLARILLRVLYTKRERTLLWAAVLMVSGNERIPCFDIRAKHGREYRRDEAAYQAYSSTGMDHRRANLGCELTYFLIKPFKAQAMHKHNHSVGID